MSSSTIRGTVESGMTPRDDLHREIECRLGDKLIRRKGARGVVDVCVNSGVKCDRANVLPRSCRSKKHAAESLPLMGHPM